MKNRVYVSLHVLCWALLLASNARDFYLVQNPRVDQSVAASGIGRGWYAFFLNLGYVLVAGVAFYGAYFLVAPYLFITKKYIRAITYFMLVLVAMVAARWVVEFHLLLPYLKFDNYMGNPVDPGYYVKNCILFTYKYCLLGLIVYFLMASNRIAKEKREIEKEKIQAELSFLRSQINPHFLFNTINDIYTLTYQKDNLAPVALLKLSSILRYMLHEGATEKVLLSKELGYLQDYIDLQGISLKHKMFVHFTLEGDVGQHQIRPLLLIPFAENIFKHGVVNDPLRPAQLQVTINNFHFNLLCKNAVRVQQKDKTGGIGLNNVRRRLELLYPGKYNFTIEETEEYFLCSLQLELNYNQNLMEERKT